MGQASRWQVQPCLRRTSRPAHRRVAGPAVKAAQATQVGPSVPSVRLPRGGQPDAIKRSIHPTSSLPSRFLLTMCPCHRQLAGRAASIAHEALCISEDLQSRLALRDRCVIVRVPRQEAFWRAPVQSAVEPALQGLKTDTCPVALCSV